MKKILYVATVDSHIKAFHLPYLKMLKGNGYEVHVATNGDEQFPYCDVKHQICIERSPFKVNNLKAIKQLKKIIDKEKFDIIHCHTPMGSVVTRLAAREARKNGTRVIYTAHGFHFYKGAPLINWMLFYPVEWYLAKYTDTLITINQEDLQRVKKRFGKRCNDIQYVPGVGIDTKKFDFEMSEKEKIKLRETLGLKKDDFVLTCVARLDKNKNQAFLIKCMRELVKEHKNIHLLLVGRDELNGKYQKISKNMNLEDNVHFLGNRDDVPQILKITNVTVSVSKREGLPVNIIESIICKIPIVAFKCRGMEELIGDEKMGYLIDELDKSKFKNKIKEIYNNKANNIFQLNQCYIEQYITDNVVKKINNIYLCKRKKKIIIARSNYVEPDSRVEKEAKSLTSNGYNVLLLTWNRNENYLMKINRKILEENKKIPRISFGAKAGFGNGMKSILPFLKFQISLFIWLILNKNKYDICHFCDFDTAFFGSIACKITRKKYVFDIFDYLSTNPDNFIQKIIEKKENNIINNAEATIICTENRIKQIQKAKPKNLTIIHNSPSNIINSSNHLYKKTDDIIKVVYVGILQDYRLLKEMVRAISESENVELHIGGFGKYENYMDDMSNRYKNIKYYGKLQYAETLKLEQSCDIMTAIYDPNIGNHIYAAPNKFYEALYLGKPLIMVKGTGMSDIVEKEKIGVLIDYSENGFKKGLEELISMKDKWKQMSLKMNKIYDNDFNWNKMEVRLIDLYNKII